MCTPIALKYNCGYARAAIRELTPRQKGRYAHECNKVKRSTEFQNLFSSFKIPSNLFESDGTHPSTFDSNCETVLDFFKQRWNPASKKSEYEMRFSTMKWKSLSAQAKEKHSLSVSHAARTFWICKKHFLQDQCLLPQHQHLFTYQSTKCSS